MMNTQFDWRTDEDNDWVEPPTPPPSPRKRRVWQWSITLFAVLLTTGSVIYYRAQQEVEALTNRIEADIRSSHALYEQAVAQGDVELLTTILSGRDNTWTANQQLLLIEGLTVDRWLFELRQHPSPTAVILSVTPSADLLSAELVAAYTYEATLEPEAVTLHHTYVYRRGEARWLLSPPESEFWGSWQTKNGRYLSLSFSERDAILATRLLTDLDDRLTTMCQTLPKIDCQNMRPLPVRLSSDPRSLADVANADLMLGDDFPVLQLPTPTLVGLPADDVAYQALLRGYAVHVVTAALVDQSGWECCQQGVFHQALIDKQLAALELRPWPLTPTEYEAMFRAPAVRINSLNRFWRLPPQRPLTGDAWRHVYGVVDYITQTQPEITVAEMQKRLVTAIDDRHWLGNYVPLSFRNTDLQRDWLRFAQGQMGQTVAPAGADAPAFNQDVQLLCNDGPFQRRVLQRFNPTTGVWTATSHEDDLRFMNPLPDDQGVVLQTRQLAERRRGTLLWRDEQWQTVASQPWNQLLIRVEAVGSNVLLYFYDGGIDEVVTSLLRVDGCDGASCLSSMIGATPVWAPDGEHLLLLTADGVLRLQDVATQEAAVFQTAVSLGQATAPFWLDEKQYGYVTTQEGARGREHWLHMRTLTDEAEDAFLLPLPETAVADKPVWAIVASPSERATLYMAVETTERPLILSYNYETGEMGEAFALTYVLPAYNPFVFSADGVWLTIQSFDPKSNVWELYLHNTTTGATQQYASDYIFAFPGYDWSVDSQWVVRAENGYLHFIAPTSGYQRVEVYDFYECKFAGWVERSL